MQINSANSFTPQSSVQIGADKQAQIQEQRDRLAVQKESNKTQQDSAKKNQQPRLDIDPEAIALVEQNQQLDANQKSSFSEQQRNYSAEYDQPSQSNQTAVSTYQSVGNIAERDNIQQAFGVDLYA